MAYKEPLNTNNPEIIFTTTTSSSGNYFLLTTDELLEITSTSVVRSVFLPNIGTVSTGKTYIISDASGAAGTNNIFLFPAAPSLINGLTSASITTNYGWLAVYSNGTNWFIWDR